METGDIPGHHDDTTRDDDPQEHLDQSATIVRQILRKTALCLNWLDKGLYISAQKESPNLT